VALFFTVSISKMRAASRVVLSVFPGLTVTEKKTVDR
jgi:hypothetical protein